MEMHEYQVVFRSQEKWFDSGAMYYGTFNGWFADKDKAIKIRDMLIAAGFVAKVTHRMTEDLHDE